MIKTWRNNHIPSLTVTDARGRESHQLVHKFFKDDGHCSYSPDRQWLLYDSYPQEGYRYLYVYHLASGQGWCLGGVKTLPRMEGVEMEIRCDLHARWNRATRIVCCTDDYALPFDFSPELTKIEQGRKFF